MRVIGVGDNVVDVYLDLNKMFPGGNALNFSVYARKLGCDAAYMGVLGDDEAGQHILSVLEHLGLDTSYCRIVPGESGFALVDIRNGDRVFVGGNGGGISLKRPITFSAGDIAYLEEFDLIHTSCYSGIEPELHKLAEMKVPVSYDFSDKLGAEYLRSVCPYVNYAFLSCGSIGLEETKAKLSETIGYGCLLAAGTRGKEGTVVYTAGEYFYQKAYPVTPVDTLGAGDSFITRFLLDVLGEDRLTREVIENTMDRASRFAASTCLIEGAFGNGIEIPSAMFGAIQNHGGQTHDKEA